ncbi:hypothetical protein ML437_07060 [Staphylococcus roterodami]|nr:hypothetical protein ML437_07060 [Staphylococcus roterodami]
MLRSSKTEKQYATATIYLYFFPDPDMPSQRDLSEHSNEILRCSGLVKEREFNLVKDNHIISVAQKDQSSS